MSLSFSLFSLTHTHTHSLGQTENRRPETWRITSPVQIKLESQRVFRVRGPRRLSSQVTETQGQWREGKSGAHASRGSHRKATPPAHFLWEKEPSRACDVGIGRGFRQMSRRGKRGTFTSDPDILLPRALGSHFCSGPPPCSAVLFTVLVLLLPPPDTPTPRPPWPHMDTDPLMRTYT